MATPLKGRPSKVIDPIVKIVKDRKRKGGVDIWIGIASKAETGCEGRWNDKYRALGLNCMEPLYITTSDAYRKKVEKAVIVKCEELNIPTQNEVGGGGGPVGSPPYIVYMAYKNPQPLLQRALYSA